MSVTRGDAAQVGSESSEARERAIRKDTLELRWRRVFPGHENQLRALRRWLTVLLPQCAARDDVISVATELGTNAVKFTASGQGGWFAAEITWYGTGVRVAV